MAGDRQVAKSGKAAIEVEVANMMPDNQISDRCQPLFPAADDATFAGISLRHPADHLSVYGTCAPVTLTRFSQRRLSDALMPSRLDAKSR